MSIGLDISKFASQIIEPDKNTEIQNIWLNGVRKDTTLLEEDENGDIKVEKRQINN